MSYLPENYPDSKETVTFQEAIQPEVRLIWEARDSLLRQLDPYTADWGLDYWENALGLLPGRGVEPDARRRQVVAKLQGRATTTPEVLETVAETLLGVHVTVAEHFSQYRVELEAEAGYRPGGGMDRVCRQLRDIMPAHLDWQLVIPTVVYVPIRVALGPQISVTEASLARGGALEAGVRICYALGQRVSMNAPSLARERPLGTEICAAPFLGLRFSIAAPPVTARHEGG